MDTSEMLQVYQDKIIIFYKQQGRMPTFSELQNLTHYRSKGGVSKMVDQLESNMFLRRDRGGKLIPGYSFLAIPFPGTVQAGFPSPADQGFNETDRIDLYDFLVKHPQDTFLHQVTGDSMIEAGIFDGDLVLSERSYDAKDGQIVIADISGNCTVKYIQTDSEGCRFLRAANAEHADIYPTDGDEIVILAVVKSVIRRFN